MLKHIEKRAGASSSKDSRDMMTMSNMRNRGAMDTSPVNLGNEIMGLVNPVSAASVRGGGEGANGHSH
jgi:hypothetical protein